MCNNLFDPETILSFNEQWTSLEEKWGTPIDLETDEDRPTFNKVFSALDLKLTTFDSSTMFKKIRKKIVRGQSNKSIISVSDYKHFLKNLKQENLRNTPIKEFFYIDGQRLSAYSVEDICEKIGNIFKSIEKLSSATSTLRVNKKTNANKKSNIPDVVQCSISAGDLSFDDTIEGQKEKDDHDDVDRYIDEVFGQINETLASMPTDDEGAIGSVTLLVKKFSDILKSSDMKCSPRRKRHCCDKFQELADFWKNRANQN